MNNNKKYDFYLAGPFFNDDQLTVQSMIEFIMDKENKVVFSPRKDAGTLPKNATKQDMYNVFMEDLTAIDNCKVLLANVSHKDLGTSVEIGYALGKNIPVVLFRHPFINDTKTVNLMIALACGGSVLQSVSELEEYVKNGTLPVNQFQFNVE